MTRYELLERIGAGGMAEIFRGKAIAAGGFEKPVAIKRILPHLSQDQRFVELLIAEAKILSQLRHRAVVQIFDVGLGDDGQYFLVMEFVDGVDAGAIQRALESRRKRLPLDLVLHMGAEVCEALEHAHSATGPDGAPMRLVHRDVSPSNVLVSRAGEVKLTDFGIAKRPEEHTGHGAVRGKFAYISPEQAENRHVDARSDVYSLGVVLFELIAGRRLFSQLPDLDALKAVREGKVPRPRELDPNLPLDVEDALMSALARDPAARVKSAAEFGARLRSIRYALESAAGDPAKELARVVAGLDAAKASPSAAAAPALDRTARGKKARDDSSYESAEPTVLRIRTADGFSDTADGTAILRARQVIDRFEEEETRMSRVGVPRAWDDDHATSSGPVAQALAMAPSGPTIRSSDDGLDEETSIMDAPRREPARADARKADARKADVRGSDARGSDARGSDARGSDARGSDARGSDARGSDARGSDAARTAPAPRILDTPSFDAAQTVDVVAGGAADLARAQDGTRSLQPRGKRTTLPPPRTAARIAAERAASAGGSATPTGTTAPEGISSRAARADSSTATPTGSAPPPRADGSASNLARADRFSTRGATDDDDRAPSRAPRTSAEDARRKQLIKIGGGAAGGIGAIAILAALLAGGDGSSRSGDGSANAAVIDAASGSGSSGPGSDNLGAPGGSAASGLGTGGPGTGSASGTDGASNLGSGTGSAIAPNAPGSGAGSGTGSGSGTGTGSAPVVRHPPRHPILKKPPAHPPGTKTPIRTTPLKPTTKPTTGKTLSTKTSPKVPPKRH